MYLYPWQWNIFSLLQEINEFERLHWSTCFSYWNARGNPNTRRSFCSRECEWERPKSCIKLTRWYVIVLQALCQCVARYLCCRPSVSMLTCLHSAGPMSVYWHVTMLQVLCQCIDMSLCYRSCVSVLTCHYATGPVSVYWHVTMLQVLCQCFDISLCYRSCVSVLTCHCVSGPVLVSWSSKPAGGSGQVSVSGQNAIYSWSPHLRNSIPPPTTLCSTCYESADSMVAHFSRCHSWPQHEWGNIWSSAGPVRSHWFY